jgi:glycine betaine catabolism B
MRVTITRIVDHAAGVKTFWLAPEVPVRYSAGEFVEVYLPHDNPDNRGTRRWFTLSSAPTENGLAITSAFTRGQSSSFKQTLAALQPGDSLQISEPLGDFILPKDSTIPITFVASGIGITPIRSITKWLADKNERRTIQLLYRAQNDAPLLFGDMFDDCYASAWQATIGTINGSDILHFSPDTPDRLFYLSGPEAFVETLAQQLQSAGVESERIVRDAFPGYTG